ncbi:hypothetical protein [Mycolicibacterium sarraceniae]|uniref:hypothetical protein n=1 Tax=Mycolicibacterium sarraceniae TaxID=1534348 RepID=UPI0013D54376|nr:hypothetical protein [Mycolicibacterium sarraceniae]
MDAGSPPKRCASHTGITLYGSHRYAKTGCKVNVKIGDTSANSSPSATARSPPSTVVTRVHYSARRTVVRM